MEYKSFYKKVSGNEGSLCHYNARLDTYGCGCSHDCSYCYAKSLLQFRGLWHPEDPAEADIQKVRRRVSKLPRELVRLGGMTDCFQPVEKRRRVTYETIKALQDYGVPYLVVTKSDMVADQEYLDLMDKDLAHIQITVTTLDDGKYRELGFEKAALPSARLRAIHALQDKGFDVAIRLSPIIPGFIDPDELAKHDFQKALVEFLRVNHWIKKWFQLDFSDWSLKSGGYLHLPLVKKKEILDTVSAREVSVCEDVPSHYKYWQENFNPNKEDCCNLKKK